MTGPLVCILAGEDARETGHAIASALGFSLDVALGTNRRTAYPGVPCYPVEWRDDFADARNQLAGQAGASDRPGDYLLWLDSDEELTAFPADAANLGGDFEGACAAAMITDRAGLTPRAITRLQRRTPLAQWANAIHETLPSDGIDPPIVAGIHILHHGYDDPARMATKRRRNARIVARARAAGADGYTLAVEEARAAQGGAAFVAWLRAFNHPAGKPKQAGGFDARFEPAKALCAFDYCKPALEVTAANPRIVDLELALLASEMRAQALDTRRLDRVVALLAGDRHDPHFSYPAELRDARADGVRAWLAANGGVVQETGT